MADVSTEVAIATQTLGSSTSTITFSSIPSTYTDLRIVFTPIGAVSNVYIQMRFNGDSGSNYSSLNIRGSGSAAGSQRFAATEGYPLSANDGLPTSYPAFCGIDVFSYASSKYKTWLSQAANDQNGSGDIDTWVGLWRSTAAITSVSLIGYNGNLGTGTTATLYGIL